MKRKRVKKLLMGVPGVERDKAEEISRVDVHGFRMIMAECAQEEIRRHQERKGRKG